MPRPLIESHNTLSFKFLAPVSRSIDGALLEDRDLPADKCYSLPIERNDLLQQNNHIGIDNNQEFQRTAKMVAERIYPGGYFASAGISQKSNSGS